jgi:hypothetical protein
MNLLHRRACSQKVNKEMKRMNQKDYQNKTVTFSQATIIEKVVINCYFPSIRGTLVSFHFWRRGGVSTLLIHFNMTAKRSIKGFSPTLQNTDLCC